LRDFLDSICYTFDIEIKKYVMIKNTKKRLLILFVLFDSIIIVGVFLYITRPSNDRNWEPAHAVLSYVTQNNNEITIHNLRSFRYRTESDYDRSYRDKTIRLSDIEGVDFIVEPFAQFEAFAHTMVSFRLVDGDNITVSIEARREVGEKWSAPLGILRQYELMYIVADEQDAVYLRTNIRNDRVHLYPTIATPEQARELFTQIMGRVNRLYQKPELYNTLAKNCTTELVSDVNHIVTKPIRFSWRYTLPGYADTLAYDLGLLGTDKSFEQLEQQTLINDRVNIKNPLENFSQDIRE
jgi:hypothetical protein